MIKLVIADDEERVCRLINALGDWDTLGIKVVGIARNGVEALQLLGREKVDILITDIRMPGYNGLELIERVKKLSDSTKVIIISGYASFEYAQNALKYGVNDYLLKPISRQALNESLQSLCCQIQKEKEQNRILEDSSREREEELSRIRRTLLNDLINVQSLALSENKLEEQYHFHARKGCYRVFILKMDLPHEKMEEETAAHFWNRAEELFLKELLDSLAMSGVANEIAGSSAPTSGSEHLISHALDSFLERPQLHGVQVGIATYIMCKILDHRWKRVDTIFTKTGFWDYCATLDLKAEDYSKAIDMAPSIKPHRHTYLHEEKYRDMAKALLSSDEKLKAILH